MLVGKSDYNPVLAPGSDVVAFLSTRSGKEFNHEVSELTSVAQQVQPRSG